ncbi:putative Norsolorinic acid reductase [Corynespora cassiicola Philippines]|uniref:Putative Norsolorinic acid reductase n=1 Tax=Corynespora cassiicola Philippines TaxID=1448308 RepID=A0A2T2PB53_CORCC|nr:putative Norsolorinic acid reductase [Corynespora cassiicola Philippines]
MPTTINFDSPIARHRLLSPTAAVRVSPLCLGAMTFGSGQRERYGDCTKEDAWGILDHFYSEGGNFIDTANGYQHGESEEWLGEWMAQRKNRDEMVIATKYSTQYMGNRNGVIKTNYVGNGSKSMKLSVEASLKKLQTTYIDLFYVHWWDYTASIPEVMHSLNDLVVSGKVIYLGISDTPAWIVSMANEYARNNGLRPFTVYQGMWNAGMRDFERDIIPMCKNQGMALCPYGVLGQGRFQTEEGYKEREKHNPGRNFIPLSEHDKRISNVLEDISKEKGCELLQVALAYVMQKTPYVFPIVGQRKVSHLKGSIAGVAIALSEEEIKKIESAYEFDHGFPHTFLSGTLFDQSTPRQAEGPQDVWLTKTAELKIDFVEEPKALRQPSK